MSADIYYLIIPVNQYYQTRGVAGHTIYMGLAGDLAKKFFSAHVYFDVLVIESEQPTIDTSKIIEGNWFDFVRFSARTRLFYLNNKRSRFVPIINPMSTGSPTGLSNGQISSSRGTESIRTQIIKNTNCSLS